MVKKSELQWARPKTRVSRVPNKDNRKEKTNKTAWFAGETFSQDYCIVPSSDTSSARTYEIIVGDNRAAALQWEDIIINVCDYTIKKNIIKKHVNSEKTNRCVPGDKQSDLLVITRIILHFEIYPGLLTKRPLVQAARKASRQLYILY